jgi:Carboxypeptidase regulatory-like domain
LVELKLDDIELVFRAQAQPSDPITELREVRDVRTEDNRSVVELRIPGATGNVLQEMGREPVRIIFAGRIWGPDRKTTIQKLLDKYGKRDPVPFSSDITTLTEVSKVLIEDLVLEAAAGKEDYLAYHIALREYRESKPTQQQSPPPSQAKEAKKDTDDDSDVRGVRGIVLGPDGKPKEGVKVDVKSDAGEWTLTTDVNGKYRMHDPAEGTYTITVDSKGYENKKRIIIIKKSAT